MAVRFHDIGNRLKAFRLGEQPNVRIGVAMFTAAREALALHQKSVEDMGQRAKGPAAATFLRELMARDPD